MAERNYNWPGESRRASDAFQADISDESAAGGYRPPSSRRASLKGNAALTSKIITLKERLASARSECQELRQEASDLQEYSTVKITRATRYLGVLSDKARKLDQVALDWEARVQPIREDKKKLLNLLLAERGNIQVNCRVRPQFEDEGAVVISFPNETSIRLACPPDASSGEPGNTEFEYDRVYGPHVSQADIFDDAQPMIQASFDGYNVSVFAYGQSGSGKTYTLEGTSREPGLLYRAVDELFQLSNTDASPASRTVFYVTMFELQGEQFRDLLQQSVDRTRAFQVDMGEVGRLVKLTGERIEAAREFTRVFNTGTRNRVMGGYNDDRGAGSHLVITFHIHHSNILLREKHSSKLSFVDMGASDQHLQVDSCIVALGDVLGALTAKEDSVPFKNSLLTSVLFDSLGGESKTFFVLNISPCAADFAESLSTLTFGSRACTKKTKSSFSFESQTELAEKQVEISRLEEENERLEKASKVANEQCAALLAELEKANSEEKSKEMDDQLVKAQAWELQQAKQAISEAVLTNKRLEEELAKRDELIERLHEENEKLFERLTKPMQTPASPAPASDSSQNNSLRSPGGSAAIIDKDLATPPREESPAGTLVSTPSSAVLNVKSTPAGEYLSAALLDFNPDQYDSSAAVGDGANKLLMLVLAAVIKAGAAREHEMLAEIRDAVFTFIRRMESRAVMDTMLVSRVRILYIRSLCSRSSELQAIQLPPVERFLERAGSGNSSRRGSSRESSPGRAPLLSPKLFHNSKNNIDDHLTRFKVNLGHEKRSKISSFFGKLRGGHHHHHHDDSHHQHHHNNSQLQQSVTGGKLRELSEDARYYAIGNKPLAALFVHTPAGELQRQIRAWLSQNIDPLSSPNGDAVENQLETLSTAIMDGWMSGLGVPQRPSTDALGQLLSDYTKLVYTSELQHLKDVSATLATEEAEDLAQASQLRSGLESVEHKRRKVLQQMRSDVALLTKEEGGSPFRTPSSANEDARIASLISLEDILKQADELIREARQKAPSSALKRSLVGRLNILAERMPTLLPIDYACAQMAIGEAQNAVDHILETVSQPQRSELSAYDTSDAPPSSGESEDAEGDVVHWSVLQFNNGSATPLVLKCGATPSLELAVKAPARVQDKNGKEVFSVVPPPSALNGLSLEEIRQLLSQVPEAFSNLILARSADGTRARYTRLYKTLALRVPALRTLVASLDADSAKDLSGFQSPSSKWQSHNHGRRHSGVDDFSGE